MLKILFSSGIRAGERVFFNAAGQPMVIYACAAQLSVLRYNPFRYQKGGECSKVVRLSAMVTAAGCCAA